MQVVAVGAQDMALTGTPEITFWKNSFKQHTHFAMESIEQTFQGQADFGRRVTAVISRNGDLVYRTYLQVTLPEINQELAASGDNVYARWLDYIGEHLIAMVEVEIGGQRIDRQYGDFMHIWNQLTLSEEQKKNYFKMIGHTTQLTYLTDPDFADINGPCAAGGGPSQVCAPRNALPETTLYIPLLFWFCKNPGLALPLLALQFHDVKIHIDFRPIGECLWAVKSLTATGSSSQAVSACYQQSLVAASLFVDYIFLDADERRKVAQEPHEYLIEQLQFTGDESVGSSSNKIKINLNHPTKELIFVVQPDANVDYCSSLNANTPLFRLLGAQPFNYTDALDALPNSIAAFGAQNAVGAGQFITNGMFELAGARSVTNTSANAWTDGSVGYTPFTEGATLTTGVSSTVSDAGTFVLAETAIDMHCWGENPVVVAKLSLNGQDRMSEREGSYFDQVQPWQHHTRGPDTGINVYSFALRPEEHQPSGTCNFSRIDNAILQLVLSSNTVSGTSTAKVRIYGISYNILRVTGGMAGQAYAS